MKAVITVIGKDSKGIIAAISAKCSEAGANIVDITQSVMHDYFAMFMLVEIDEVAGSFPDFREKFEAIAKEKNLDIRVMHEDIFNSMHRI